jgi:hypothetical protein
MLYITNQLMTDMGHQARGRGWKGRGWKGRGGNNNNNINIVQVN